MRKLDWLQSVPCLPADLVEHGADVFGYGLFGGEGVVAGVDLQSQARVLWVHDLSLVLRHVADRYARGCGRPAGKTRCGSSRQGSRRAESTHRVSRRAKLPPHAAIRAHPDRQSACAGKVLSVHVAASSHHYLSVCPDVPRTGSAFESTDGSLTAARAVSPVPRRRTDRTTSPMVQPYP